MIFGNVYIVIQKIKSINIQHYFNTINLLITNVLFKYSNVLYYFNILTSKACPLFASSLFIRTLVL